MVRHLTTKPSGAFHWDGQREHASFATKAEADDWRLVAKRRDTERHLARMDKVGRVESVLLEAFPRRER